ncbi:pectin lyase fold/virulence factor [Dactylonectria estremocensis]|uniref:galacturonan 1,4-alpha-galacturonidase n=1 Tax=Dactylonectria estremocensis TaxID=1079267 RepID=A0A9P9DG57_9HYPO|nr:pectin lyase fold/virulence factor [Dactylonectria estremocensis]
MKFSSILPLVSLLAGALVSAVELPAGVPRNVAEFRNKHPWKAPTLHHRKKVTIRSSKNDLDDISDEFVKGLKKANHGGTLYLPKGHTYMIGKPLDLTWLNDIHIHLEGEIKFTNDTEYWQANAFAHPFQNSLMFWKWGGKDIKFYGEGVLNGNGQRWWNEFSGLEILDPDNEYLRPILFYAQNATGLEIEGIHLKDSPCWTTFIVTSQDIAFRDVICTAESNNATVLPKNTDFFDSLNVEHVTVERAWINIGDDCFSPKSNATDIHIDTMYCNGTHGQSMGSLGQYAGEKSFVQDVVIENVWLLNGQHGARLKTWAGPDVGYGFIDNVTFRNFWNANNDYSAYIDSCYFNINSTVCAQYPSQMNITNVLFQNFTGYTSGKYGRAVAKLTCSTNPNAVCENIKFEDFNVESPCGGTPLIICDGVSDIGTDCYSVNSPEAKAALADKCTTAQASASPFPVRDY